MTTKLGKLVKVIHNDKDCVIFEVKPKKFKELICTGCFEGTETLFRITKTPDSIGDLNYTIWEGEKHFTWSGNTLVSDSVFKKATALRECAADFGIQLRGVR